MMELNNSSTEAVSIKNYEIQISRSDFTHIHVYLYRVSFLTTLFIYKDYFKGPSKVMQSDAIQCKLIVHAKLWLGIEFALVHHIPCRSYCVFVPRVLYPRSFLIFIVGWVKELCSQHLPQVGVLVMYLDPCINWLVTYWEPCIERRDCHYITSPIGYWGKSSTISWYYVLGFLSLLTTCFDNSGFSGVVTLNSSGGVLP